LITREREKVDFAFSARRKTIRQIVLPQVRQYRLGVLEQEERDIREHLERKAQAYPEMFPLLMIRAEGGGDELA